MAFAKVLYGLWLALRYPHVLWRNGRPRARKGLLILGWYGRETTGDKAILASILENNDLAGVDVYQASYDVEYSRQTLREIGDPAVQVIPNDLASVVQVLPWVDVVLIGGGPLMERRQMRAWRRRLLAARLLGKKIMVYACGVGPLRSAKDAAAVRSILELADEITLRDELSAETAAGLGIAAERITVAADPALSFGPQAGPRLHRPDGDRLRIGISIRSLPGSYYSVQAGKSLTEVRQQYLASFVALVDFLNRQPQHEIVLVPMQMHPDDDDRQILRQVRKRAAQPDRLQVLDGYRSPADLVEQFRTFDFFVGMRFHSIVFSYLTGTPAVGIDYDMQTGKVTGIMRLMANSDFTLNVAKITPARLIALVDRGLRERHALRERLRCRLDSVQALERHSSAALDHLLRAG